MEENIKNANQEKDLNAIHNRMFDQNGETFYEEVKMNREYLKRVYNGVDMDFLPKDARLTRTQYYKMVADIEKEISQEIQRAKKQIIIAVIVFIGVWLVSTIFSGISMKYSRAESEIYNAYKEYAVEEYGQDIETFEDIRDAQNNIIADGIHADIRAFQSAAKITAAIGWLIFCCDVVMLAFFVISSTKIIAKQKIRRKESLKRLENLKEEHMMLGTYDAEF